MKVRPGRLLMGMVLIEFRAESFNLPNHMNPGNPITALNNQNFGKIQSAFDPRILQFAVKYLF